MSKPIDADLFSQFPFLKNLIGEEEFLKHGAEVESGARGDGTVFLKFGPKTIHGRQETVELDQSGKVLSSVRVGESLREEKDRFVPEDQVRALIQKTFGSYEFRSVLAARVSAGYHYDVASENGSNQPDGKVTHHDLWDLATTETFKGKTIQEIAKIVEMDLLKKGFK